MNRRRIRIAAIVVGVLVVLGAYSAWCLYRAAQAGTRAKNALVAAEASLEQQDVDATRTHLREAQAAFADADSALGRMGPLRTVGHVMPFVRVQLRGVEKFVSAGDALTVAAGHLTDALDELLHPPDGGSTLSRSIGPLRNMQAALRGGVAALDAAAADIAALNDLRLLGPLDGARNDLVDRLPRAIEQARQAEQGVTALLRFAGADGPKRFLVLAQNPDEVRPTGGFIGSYGVLETDGNELRLERFEGIEQFNEAHPDVFLPEEAEATPFRFLESGLPQRMSNINALIDWRIGGQLALQLWQQAGEAPADGALLITPEVLVRVLNVLGPVQVDSYGETVNGNNLIERVDFYTHLQAAADRPPEGRKAFLAAVAQVVMDRLLDAPTEQWKKLGEQMVAAFDAREAMGFTTDDVIAPVLADHEWDGRIPEGDGDFFVHAPFEFAAKNGRGLRRTYDHNVKIESDGSATVTTTMTLENTRPLDIGGKVNIEATFYDTYYLPTGATVDPASDPPFVANEDPVSGHPAVGYYLRAAPLGQTTIRIVTHVPKLLVDDGNGRWRYSLFWRHIPTTENDVLRLSFDLPDGWRWINGSPPAEMPIRTDIQGEWSLSE